MQAQRINPNPALHDLKMQMVASLIHIPNNLPCRYRFTSGNGSLRFVGIQAK